MDKLCKEFGKVVQEVCSDWELIIMVVTDTLLYAEILQFWGTKKQYWSVLGEEEERMAEICSI
jgi:hypothetical protein